jgi:hypothetical protein
MRHRLSTVSIIAVLINPQVISYGGALGLNMSF